MAFSLSGKTCALSRLRAEWFRPAQSRFLQAPSLARWLIAHKTSAIAPTASAAAAPILPLRDQPAAELASAAAAHRVEPMLAAGREPPRLAPSKATLTAGKRAARQALAAAHSLSTNRPAQACARPDAGRGAAAILAAFAFCSANLSDTLARSRAICCWLAFNSAIEAFSVSTSLVGTGKVARHRLQLLRGVWRHARCSGSSPQRLQAQCSRRIIVSSALRRCSGLRRRRFGRIVRRRGMRAQPELVERQRGGNRPFRRPRDAAPSWLRN